MTEELQFELVFLLPEGEHDPFALSDAVFGTGHEDAIVGTGHTGLLRVELEASGADPETVILDAARGLIKSLPAGTVLREVRPDLVTLKAVARRLGVSRPALSQRKMPLPVVGGLYRIDEIVEAVMEAFEPQEAGQRCPRLNLVAASKWFRAGPAARRLNALLTLREIDPATLERTGAAK
ncbi:hypothetical protein [Salipiger sp. PrR003]|uniref:hypothetical protein n=1 Tax=Salipiger sp. PrR003 TaxID=2706776 RepID=UPI0013DA4CF6|nr:hypothetical protein [Salipiger sp. PrR003]NDV52912.1 hypothetical protein [Salipiger sp. PrR003]